jgi:hypothetical protein
MRHLRKPSAPPQNCRYSGEILKADRDVNRSDRVRRETCRKAEIRLDSLQNLAGRLGHKPGASRNISKHNSAVNRFGNAGNAAFGGISSTRPAAPPTQV